MQALGSWPLTISVDLGLTKGCLEPVLHFAVFATRFVFQVPSCIGIRSSGDYRFGPWQKIAFFSSIGWHWFRLVQQLICFIQVFWHRLGHMGPSLSWTLLGGQLAQWCTSLPSRGISRDWSKTLVSTTSRRESAIQKELGLGIFRHFLRLSSKHVWYMFMS